MLWNSCKCKQAEGEKNYLLSAVIFETVTEQSRMSAERFVYVLMCLKPSSVIPLHPQVSLKSKSYLLKLWGESSKYPHTTGNL